jgi:hypothetical protein
MLSTQRIIIMQSQKKFEKKKKNQNQSLCMKQIKSGKTITLNIETEV